MVPVTLDAESHPLVSLSDCEAATLLGGLGPPNAPPPPTLPVRPSLVLLENPNGFDGPLVPPGLRGLTGLVLALDGRLPGFRQFVLESATSGETHVGGPLLLLVLRGSGPPLLLLPHEFDDAPPPPPPRVHPEPH